MASAHYRRPLTVIAACLALTAAIVAAVLFRVHRTLSSTAHDVSSSHHLPFRFGPLAAPPNPGFETITAASSFHAGAALAGHIFLAGPAALNEYTASGVLEHSFRTGIELPSAPLGTLAVGRLRTQPAPVLLIATSGAGVLLYTPGSQRFAQLLPRDSALGDITALATLPSGELLLGTRRAGLLSFDGKTLELYRPEYNGQAITSLLVTDTDVWAGTQENGLLHTHAGTTEHLRETLPDAHIDTLASAADRVFAATPTGIAVFENGRLSRTIAAGAFAHALHATATTLTFSTLDGDIQTLPLAGTNSTSIHAQTIPQYLSSPPDPTANTLSSRPERSAAERPTAPTTATEQFLSLGNDLYAIRHDGLFHLNGQPALTPTAAALTDNNIAALSFAADGKLWVGTFDRGLDILNPTTGNATHLEDDHLFCINRIALDPERNTMAVATANGLVLFDSTGKPRQTLTRRDGLIADQITDIIFSHTPTGPRMTVATPAGLTFVDASGIRSLYAFQGLVNNHVYTLASAGSGHLLAGTLGGVSLLANDSVERNLTVGNSGLRHNWITAAVPFEGAYLVGTYGAGVMQLDARGRFTDLDNVTRTMVINPNAMLATSTHIYAGSLNQGLWVYSRAGRTWTQITAGLPSLNVTALAAREGALYVGTQNGLVRIAESKLPQ